MAGSTTYGAEGGLFPTYGNVSSSYTPSGTFWRGADGNVWVAGDQGVNSAGAWDDNSLGYWNHSGYSYINDPNAGNTSGSDSGSTLGSSTYGSGGGGGGYSAPSYDPADLAYLDSQAGLLSRQYDRTGTTLTNSLDALTQNYNKDLSGANLTRSRNLEDFDDKTEVSEMGRSRELGKVDTRGRMLADSLRQRLGLASGSGSSAYQLTAPRAVQRESSQQRGDVLGDYAANFQELDKNKKRSLEDFDNLLAELNRQKSQREGGVHSDIETTRNDIRGNQARVAGERARLLGGGYTGARAAMAPYESQIAGGESLIDGIYNKYAAKYNVNPIQERKTNLRDYMTDNVAVRDQQATGNQDQYSPFRNFAEEDEEENQLASY